MPLRLGKSGGVTKFTDRRPFKAQWNLICNPNNCTSCHDIHAWQEVQYWDQASDPSYALLPSAPAS